MQKDRILLVDDDARMLPFYKESFELHGFEVTAAGTVDEALRLITANKFDVLLTDQHLPNPAGGFALATAMRHAQPDCVTFLYSAFPLVQEGLHEIRLQVDEIVVKPFGLADMVKRIREKLANPQPDVRASVERVASILERNKDVLVGDWLSRVEQQSDLTAVALTADERTGHLPLLLSGVVHRLTFGSDAKALVSSGARRHGRDRKNRGYTVAMMVEESRILQVCIFNLLQNNLGTVDFATVLLDVMITADEVDWQLKQATLGFAEAQE